MICSRLSALPELFSDKGDVEQEAATQGLAVANTESVRLSKLLQRASKDEASATFKLRSAQSALDKVTGELTRCREQHAALLADNTALTVMHQKAIEDGKRAEQGLHACSRASASALQDMEGFLQQLSRTVSSQVKEIASLKQTVVQQCRQRLELQQHLANFQNEPHVSDYSNPLQHGQKVVTAPD